MKKTSNKPLKANPFIAYRDPHTGRWLVLKMNNEQLLSQTMG
ncbi:MAG TPA: hypothetical protein V6C57_11065 [Coleofasciculaceae cyanobacterium]